MIRILIVEDDALFRKKIRTLLDWELMGFTICGDCINGKEALEKMKTYAPDIILTDISMSQMNGIEMIRIVRKEYPGIRIIVLSSYDNFDFVKEAMKLGADDYVLKYNLDSEMDQFLHILEETKKKILTPGIDSDSNGDNSKSLVLDAYMTRVLKGYVTSDNEIERQLRQLLVYFPFGRYMVAVLYARSALAISDIEKEKVGTENTTSEHLTFFRKLVSGLARPGSSQRFVFMPDEAVAVCAFNMKNIFSKNRMQDTVKSALSDLFKNEMDFCIGVSEPVEGIAALANGYDEGCKAADATFLYARQDITFYDPQLMQSELQPELRKMADKIAEALRDGEQITVTQKIKELVHFLYCEKVNFAQIASLCEELTGQLEKWSWKYSIPLEEITRYRHIPAKLLCKSYSQTVFEQYLQNCYARALDFSHISIETNNIHVKDAIKYINTHYPELMGLTDVARALELNENYLSNLFKQETGMRFVGYLNEVRLHHAKILLADGSLKMYEIARKCGFQSATYFCRLLKEKTGISFTEYRNRKEKTNIGTN